MKNIFKISAALFIGVSLVVSSCKKEEVLIDGCTDSSAMNYLFDATSNDGSCVFAYGIAQGTWNIASDCQSLTVLTFEVPLNDMFPDTVEISGEGEGVVAMDINGNIILADVSINGDVTIRDGQKISLDTGVIGVVDVDITGYGKIETATNGDLTLNLAFEVPLAGTQSSSCVITFSK